MPRTTTASSSPRSPAGPPAVPEGARAIDETLQRLGIRPSRRLGQSFLIDPFAADAEAALVDAPAGHAVVEIGGGLGMLTAALLRRGIRPLTIVERDGRLVAFLRSTFGDRIKVDEADGETYPFPAGATVVGNLPFSVATPILLALFARRTPRVVAMVQREVAERLAAGPGSKTYGRLSIVAQLYGEVELLRTVPRSSFYPVPEVEGRVFVHRARTGPLPVPNVDRFERLVRTLFSSRRKQLANLFPRLGRPMSELERLAREAEWPTDWRRKRPENLPPEAYFRLATALELGPSSSPPGPSAE